MREGRKGRLLVVTNTLRGGTGSHLVRLLSRIDPSRWEIRLVCHGRREFEPPAHVSLIDDSVRKRYERFPLAQWRQLQKLRQVIRGFQPDVYHAFFFWPIIYGRILKRLGSVAHLVENREDQGFNWSPTDYRLLRASASVPDRVVCVSGAVRDVVLENERVPPDRLTVVHNGVTLPAAGLATEDAAAARAEFGFQGDHRIVGMVANLDFAVKGAPYLIESVPLVLEQVPEARFLLLGDGRTKEDLRSRARELGVEHAVVFAGFRSDVDRFYRIMDVSVLTSLSEGLSITVLESMSHGLPMVATRVGGNPELIRDGETGLLVPSKEPRMFADALVRVLKEPSLRQSMGREGRRVVERSFSLEAVASRYEDIYLDLMEAHEEPA